MITKYSENVESVDYETIIRSGEGSSPFSSSSPIEIIVTRGDFSYSSEIVISFQIFS